MCSAWIIISVAADNDEYNVSERKKPSQFMKILNRFLFKVDYSGDGSGGGEDIYFDGGKIFKFLVVPDEDSPEDELTPFMREDRVLWRDAFGDLRKQSENARITTLLNYVNADGLPDPFRRLTTEYLKEIILLISQRLGAAPFNRHMSDCADRIPERFYRINYAAFDSLKHCPECIRDIGVKYVGSVHNLVLDLFNCLDDNNNNVHPADGNYNQQRPPLDTLLE